jgi:ABC-2 type transport system ATP-binding protein
VIRIEELVKRYGGKIAVDHLSLEIPPGEIFALLGPNGAGKTTTVKILVGLLQACSGRVEICGLDARSESIRTRRKIAYVPDQPYLYEKLTGREFLLFMGRMFEMKEEEISARIDELSILFEMEGFLDQLSENYSHGMKQRVVFSSALMHRPEVLVVDEPMVAFDPRGARLVKDLLLEEARRGCAVFVSTHSLDLVEETANRIGILRGGRLIALGTFEELQKESGVDARLEDVFLELTREEAGGNEFC